ncbi:MAG: hypothetical protein P8163_14840 [Candidatus Thiodiazotropha sp.]
MQFIVFQGSMVRRLCCFIGYMTNGGNVPVHLFGDRTLFFYGVCDLDSHL